LVDIEFNGTMDALSIQKQVDNLCKTQLIPALEALLGRYNTPGDLIRIDRMVVELTGLSLHDFEGTFASRALNEIEKVLQEKLNNAGVSAERIAEPANLMRLLGFYLKNGFMPWWSTIKNIEGWHNYLLDLFENSSQSTSTELRVLLKESNARARFIIGLNDNIYWSLIKNILPEIASCLQGDLASILAHKWSLHMRNQLEFIYMNSLLDAWANQDTAVQVLDDFSALLLKGMQELNPKGVGLVSPAKLQLEELRNAFSQWQQSNGTWTMDLQSPDTSSGDIQLNSISGSTSPAGEPIFINNAGLAIIAPYLSMLFRQVDILVESQITHPSKAIALIQFLAKGSEGYAEFETAFPKILCGAMPAEVFASSPLSAEEKRQAIYLLESVIEHWAVLKNTSVQGLREAFLQREGRLQYQNNEWVLLVQQESYDVLLSHIPWNINLIRLPWMPALLRVDWF